MCIIIEGSCHTYRKGQDYYFGRVMSLMLKVSGITID